MNCWNCGAPLPEFSWGKVSFRERCEKCDAALHCCQNCKFYKPGMHNDCAVPGTDFVSDRKASNFCEEFALLGKGPSPKNDSAKKKFENLFGDE
jgi:hypothetical protein